MTLVFFITHPDVQIDAAVPVPQWSLSVRGRERMHKVLAKPWARQIRAIYSSTERKATDGAQILAGGLGIGFETIAALGENDRSATGYLPKPEFELTADRFFAHPGESVRGWERAIDAQRRIVATIDHLLAQTPRDGEVAIVSHGAVGALYLCHLKRCPISRSQDQPATNGGNYYAFEAAPRRLVHDWRSIDD